MQAVYSPYWIRRAPRQTKEGEKDFEDYDLGLMTMDFAEKVEIVETYLPESMLTPLDQAIEDVIKDQETPENMK